MMELGFFAFIGFDSVGPAELLVLFAVVLIVVGPKNMPAAARKLGSFMATLRRAADEFKRQLMTMDEVDSQPSTTAGESEPPPPPPEPPPSDSYIDVPPASDDFPMEGSFDPSVSETEAFAESGSTEAAQSDAAEAADASCDASAGADGADTPSSTGADTDGVSQP